MYTTVEYRSALLVLMSEKDYLPKHRENIINCFIFMQQKLRLSVPVSVINNVVCPNQDLY